MELVDRQPKLHAQTIVLHGICYFAVFLLARGIYTGCYWLVAAISGVLFLWALYSLGQSYVISCIFILLWFIPAQTAPMGLLESFRVLRWLAFIICPLLLLITIAPRVLKRTFDSGPIFLPMICIFLTIMFSGLINRRPLLHVVMTCAIYLNFPLLFIAFINMDRVEAISNGIIKLLLVLTFLQVPEVLWRYFVSGFRGDNISFSLGIYGTFPLGIYCIYSISLIWSHGLLKGLRWYHVLWVMILLMIAPIGEIKILFISGPICILIILFIFAYIGNRYTVPRYGKLLFRSLVALVIIALSIYFFINTWDIFSGSDKLLRLIDKATNLLGLSNTTRGEATIYRFATVSYVFAALTDSLHSMLFGLGPGNSLAGNFIGQGGLLMRLKMDNPALAGSQIAGVMADIGFVGVLIHAWMFLTILHMGIKAYKKRKNDYVNLAIFGIWFFYFIIGPLYNIVWRYEASSFIFWILAARIYKKSNSLAEDAP